MTEIKKTLKAGTLLHGEKLTYEVEAVLGAGTFGITYKAKTRVTIGNVTHTVRYAIKEFFVAEACLRADDGSVIVNTAQKELYTSQLAAFRREARMLCDMPKHQGIVSVNERIDAFNTSYYVMEYLGESLAHHIESAPSHILSEPEALEIFLNISKAVAFLHSHYRLHLDIKPDNIMFYEEQPKLIDFGQSRVFDGKDYDRQKGTVSAGFSPLEQYKGINSFSPSADIYALGATLLYMLSGKRPVEAKDMTAEYIDSVLPPGIAEETRQVLHKCLARDPRQRGERISDILSILGYIISDDNGTTLIAEDQKPDRPCIHISGTVKKALIGVLVIVLAFLAVWQMLPLFSGMRQHTDRDTVTAVTDTVRKDSVSTDVAGPVGTNPKDTVVKKSTGPETAPGKPNDVITKEGGTDEKPVKQPENNEAPKNNTLDYASWSGRVINGKPDGYGKMTFTRPHLIPGTSIRAEVGDVLKGAFSDGRLVNGELNGKYIEVEER
ncbi:MAG: serine/threonine-protein kinase [Prevotellaceae bacterium]|nr:serine/threonine-protein kinase [Prevotellaceae bacterium]MDO4932318.1 serine/threonine-protein kinase [Prevotellaceae bacterium]